MSNTTLPRVGDGELRRLTERIEQAIQALEAHPLAGMIILSSLPIFTGGFVRAYHGLGRPARGAFIVRAAVDVRVAVSTTPDAIDPLNWFALSASANATVDLAVF